MAEATPLHPLSDIHIRQAHPLISPAALKELYPLTPASNETTYTGRQQVINILKGKDKRILGIVGPCSIHSRKVALDYAERLKGLQEKVSESMLLLMRVYFEKPRTVLGWRGLITDPDLDGSYKIEKGLKQARQILLEITEMGLPVGSEILEPIIPQYIADLISWAAIGARTTESQTHRQMASGLSMPVGFKNGTSGNLKLAVDAMEASRHPQSFIGIDQAGNTCVLHTRGNPNNHIILRGGRDAPNYYEENVEEAREMLAASGIEPAIMIDCSHMNSGKDPFKQERVLRALTDYRKRGLNEVVGFMLESNLFEGSQAIGKNPAELIYGVSITDACIGWDTTEKMLLETHEVLSGSA
jgi:3-deoxy-7-phosphoheptulonate synthase